MAPITSLPNLDSNSPQQKNSNSYSHEKHRNFYQQATAIPTVTKNIAISYPVPNSNFTRFAGKLRALLISTTGCRRNSESASHLKISSSAIF
jgi:hypothetical protein